MISKTFSCLEYLYEQELVQRGIIGMEDCITGKCKGSWSLCFLHISLPPRSESAAERKYVQLRMQDKFVSPEI